MTATRSTKRRNLLIVFAVVVFALAAWSVRAYLHEEEKLQAGPVGGIEALAALHTGPEPCLRWRDPSVDLEIGEDVVRQLRAAGINRDAFGGVSGLLYAWGREREEQLHAKSEVDEVQDLMSRGGFWSSVVARLNRGRIEKMLAIDWEPRKKEGLAAYAKLTPEAQASLRSIFDAHPGLGDPQGMLATIRWLEVLQTRDTLEALAEKVRAVVDASGERPGDLAALVPAPEDRQDAWHEAILLVDDARGLRVISQGRDMEPGGEGFDADLEVQVAPAAPAAPAATAVQPE